MPWIETEDYLNSVIVFPISWETDVRANDETTASMKENLLFTFPSFTKRRSMTSACMHYWYRPSARGEGTQYPWRFFDLRMWFSLVLFLLSFHIHSSSCFWLHISVIVLSGLIPNLPYFSPFFLRSGSLAERSGQPSTTGYLSYPFFRRSGIKSMNRGS